MTLRNTVFALLGLALTGAASLWLLTVAATSQTAAWATSATAPVTTWLGFAGAAGATVAGLSALAISLSARERGPVRAFALAALFALALLFAYASRGGFS